METWLSKHDDLELIMSQSYCDLNNAYSSFVLLEAGGSFGGLRLDSSGGSKIRGEMPKERIDGCFIGCLSRYNFFRELRSGMGNCCTFRSKVLCTSLVDFFEN